MAFMPLVPTVVSCLWGSSAHLITGPTTAVSLVVFSTVQNLASHESLEYVGLVLFLSLMVGALQMLVGHSIAGFLLQAAAPKAADKISQLIFLNA